MIELLITCDTGRTWVTSINLKPEEATEYFLGKTFTREENNGTEIADTIVSVKLL